MENTILNSLEKVHDFCNKNLPAVITGLYPSGDGRLYAQSTKIQRAYSNIWNPMRKLQRKIYCGK